VIDSNGPNEYRPALLTSTSGPPNSYYLRKELLHIVSFRDVALRRERLAALYYEAPAAANPFAIPAPIPFEAPVTSATLPSKMPMLFPHLFCVSCSDSVLMVSKEYLVSIRHLCYTKWNQGN
jgi:hypothetical protein